MKKPWACKFGFHSIYIDSQFENLGTPLNPFYMVTKVEDACNNCDYRKIHIDDY